MLTGHTWVMHEKCIYCVLLSVSLWNRFFQMSLGVQMCTSLAPNKTQHIRLNCVDIQRMFAEPGSSFTIVKLYTIYFFTDWTAFMIMGLHRTYHARQFTFRFFFLYIFGSFRVVVSAGYPSAFYCTLNTHYHIVSYRRCLSEVAVHCWCCFLQFLTVCSRPANYNIQLHLLPLLGGS